MGNYLLSYYYSEPPPNPILTKKILLNKEVFDLNTILIAKNNLKKINQDARETSILNSESRIQNNNIFVSELLNEINLREDRKNKL